MLRVLKTCMTGWRETQELEYWTFASAEVPFLLVPIVCKGFCLLQLLKKLYLSCRKSGELSSLEENWPECDTCITCNKVVTDDSFECVWCRKWQHRVCVSLSVGQYSTLSDLPNNIVFFCSHCIYKLPNALMGLWQQQGSVWCYRD